MARDPGGHLPIGVQTFAVLLTGVVLSWMVWETVTGYRAARQDVERNAQIEALRSKIVHLDEVLTMSARMAAMTGDRKWIKRYERHEPELDAAIKRAIEIAPEPYSDEQAALTDQANVQLVRMEREALALVREQGLEEAQDILFSPEYEKQKRIYAQGITRFAVTPHLDLRLERLRGTIVHLDEVLTMSARMAVETGEKEWIDRYEKYEPKLDAAIEEAKALAPEAFAKEAADKTDAANVALVKMERRAFELIGQNKGDEAKALLYSTAYEDEKLTYADGMRQFAAQLEGIADERARAERAKASVKAAVNIAVLALLMVGWLFVLRATRLRQQAQVQSNRELTQQAGQLADLNRTLEQEVGERRRAAERLRLLLESTHVVPWQANAETCQFTYVGPQAVNLLGYPIDEWLKEEFWPEHIHPEDREHAVGTLREATHRGQHHEFEYRMIAADGRIVWVHDLVSVVSRNGEPTTLRGFMIDITERKLAEQIMRGHNRILERLAAGAPLDQVLSILAETAEEARPEMLCSVLLLDDDKKHLRHGAAPSLPAFYNEAIDGMEIGPSAGSCGTAAYTGKRVIIEDVMTHPFWKDFRELAQRAGLGACWSEPIISSTGETLGTFAMYYREPRGPDDSDLEFIQSAAYLAGIAIERKQLDLRLRLTDRLASIGTLTAGMVHDVTNVIMPIRCRLDALNWNSVPAELREFIESIHQAVEYLQQLVKGLGSLAQDSEGTDADTVTTMCDWWAEVKPLMNTAVPERVVLDSDFPADLPLVRIAPHHLTQAVLNLIVNSVEATRDRGRLRVWAETSRDRETVRLCVSDDGVGMSEEAKVRAFDPFFTTKTRSISTGLGLWLVHNVITSAGGTVDIDSAPGRGTIVALTLPICTVPAVKLEADVRGRAAVSVRDSQTVAWITMLLRSAGYEVQKAENGDPADSDVWVTEPTEENLAAARRFSAGTGQHRIITLGPAQADWIDLGAAVVEDPRNLAELRAVLHTVTAEAKRNGP